MTHDQQKFVYNNLNRLDSVITSNRKLSDFLYDDSKRIKQIQMHEIWWDEEPCMSTHRFTYGNDGNLAKYALTGLYDIEVEYTWNPSGILISDKSSQGENLPLINDYEYDCNGNLHSIFNYDSYSYHDLEVYSYIGLDASELAPSTLQCGHQTMY